MNFMISDLYVYGTSDSLSNQNEQKTQNESEQVEWRKMDVCELCLLYV